VKGVGGKLGAAEYIDAATGYLGGPDCSTDMAFLLLGANMEAVKGTKCK
jgi:hypothetical protein